MNPFRFKKVWNALSWQRTLVALLVVLSLALPGKAAEEATIFSNRMGMNQKILSFKGTSPGNIPVELTGPLEYEQEVSVASTLLRSCNRSIVTLDSGMLQFFTVMPLEGLASVTLRSMAPFKNLKNFQMPILHLKSEMGAFGIVSGLPFHLLYGDMDYGMTEERFAMWMNPLNQERWESTFAVSFAEASWNVLPDSVVFSDQPDGRRLLTALSMKFPATDSVYLRIFRELRELSVSPHLVQGSGLTPLVFSPKALEETPGATQVEGLDGADFVTVWKMFLSTINKTSEKLGESSASNRVLKAVLVGGAVQFTVEVGFDNKTFTLHLAR